MYVGWYEPKLVYSYVVKANEPLCLMLKALLLYKKHKKSISCQDDVRRRIRLKAYELRSHE